MLDDENRWAAPEKWAAEAVPARDIGPRPELVGAGVAVDRELLLSGELGELGRKLERLVPGRVGLFRLRTTLAGLPDDEYAAVIARLGELRERSGSWPVLVATSVLAPTEQHWVDADVAAVESSPWRQRALLVASVSTRAQVEKLAEHISMASEHEVGRRLIGTALTRVGTDGALLLQQCLPYHWHDEQAALSRECAGLLAEFPTDEAFSILLANIGTPFHAKTVREAAERFPHRALRMLKAVRQPSPTVLYLIDHLARTYPEVGAEFGFRAQRYREAVASELPEALRQPPVDQPKSRSRRPVLAGLPEPTPIALAWADGEQAVYAGFQLWNCPPQMDYAKALAQTVAERDGTFVATQHEPVHYVPRMLAMAPDEVARPYLRMSLPDQGEPDQAALKRMLGRFGAEALDFVLPMVLREGNELPAVMAPMTGTEITRWMSHRLGGKNFANTARVWLDRHSAAAIPDLITDSFAKLARDRKFAHAALRYLATEHRALILTTAAGYGPGIADAVAPHLDAPVQRIPALPEWFSMPRTVPVVLTADRAALPEPAVRAVVTYLMLSAPEGKHAAVTELIEIADRDSLAEFAWSLFELWRMAEFPTEGRWVLRALGLLGTDETANHLVPYLKAWPSESFYARAVSGLDALATIGTEGALLHLHRLSLRSDVGSLSYEASKKIKQVAAQLNLTTEDLADRLVPAFGFDAEGTLTLDYGRRGFVVRLDEQLGVIVFDATRGDDGGWVTGKQRKAVPRPGVNDEGESATSAHRSYAAMRKGLKSEATEQIRRVERAMIARRRWTVEVQQRVFDAHPLLSRITRRLVWAAFDETGSATAAFRIAEDGSYADVDDKTVELPDDATVGIAHPVDLGAAVAEWGEVFADYELLQPFEQLQRVSFAPGSPEVLAGLSAFEGSVAGAGPLLALRSRGWDLDGFDGLIDAINRRSTARGGSVRLTFSPGIDLSEPMARWEQTLISIHTSDELSALDPVTASELLRDLHTLR